MRRGAAAALAMALAVFLLLSSGPAARGSPNLLFDDFEQGVGDWQAGGGSLDATCAFAHESGCSAVLSSDVARPSTIQYHRLVAIQPSADYKLSAYVYKNDPEVQSVELHLWWLSRTGVWNEADRTFTSRLTNDSPDWRLLSLTGTAPPGTDFVQPRIGVVFNGSGTVYFDDVTLEGPPPLPPTDTPEASDTPAVVTPQPSTTPISTAVATATATKEGSATPTTVPSATPTAGPSDSLVNGSFEDADASGPAGWSKYGGDLQQSSAHARSGLYSGAFSSNTTSTKWAYQTVLVSGGSAYDFSAYVLLDDPGVSEAYLRISWYASADGSDTALATSDSTTHLSDLDPSFRFLTTSAVLAPAEARSARLRVMLAPGSDGPATIYIDDASFGPAAPPAAETASPSVPSISEPLQSDIGVPALIQRVTKPRATVAGQSVVRQATPTLTGLASHAAVGTQRPRTTNVGATSTAPRQTSDDARRRVLISLASGAAALVIGGCGGLFLVRLNDRRL